MHGRFSIIGEARARAAPKVYTPSLSLTSSHITLISLSLIPYSNSPGLTFCLQGCRYYLLLLHMKAAQNFTCVL